MNCYAETMAGRFCGDGEPYDGLIRTTASGPRWNGEVKFVAKHLLDPLRWKKPRRVFVNSMSDVFHEGFTNQQIAAQFAVMMASPQHTYQVLTKRPKRMAEFFMWLFASGNVSGILKVLTDSLYNELGYTDEDLPNDLRKLIYAKEWAMPIAVRHIMLGTSVENQQTADARLPYMLVMKYNFIMPLFLSCEPLLGWVDLGDYIKIIDWVIVGGESGAGARPMQIEWARSLRDQCQRNDVPFFFKQWGQWAPTETGHMVRHSRKDSAGNLLDGESHMEWPPVPPASPLTGSEALKMLASNIKCIEAAGLMSELHKFNATIKQEV